MSSFSGSSKPRISQKVFDAMVIDIKDSTPGATLGEAVQEAIGTFEEDYSLDGLYLYTTPEELQSKAKLEAAVATIERTAAGQDSSVNARFCFQGIKQALTAATAAKAPGPWRLLESRRLAHTLVRLLRVAESDADADGEGRMKEDAEDDEEEDEEEDTILFHLSVLETLLLLLRGASFPLSSASYSFSSSSAAALQLSPHLWYLLLSRLDADVGEPRVVAALADCLEPLLAVEGNLAVFLEGAVEGGEAGAAAAAAAGAGAGGAGAACAAAEGGEGRRLRGLEVLALAAKFNSKNAAGARANALLLGLGGR